MSPEAGEAYDAAEKSLQKADQRVALWADMYLEALDEGRDGASQLAHLREVRAEWLQARADWHAAHRVYHDARKAS